jgi:hypothetical protein
MKPCIPLQHQVVSFLARLPPKAPTHHFLIHQKVTARKETYIQTSIMPKISKRKQTIKHLSKVCHRRLLERFQRDDDSSDEENILEDDLDLAFMSRLEHVRSRRYLSRGQQELCIV